MNASSRTNTTEAVSALVNSLETHEGTLTDRERQLCTTLLNGLAAAGQLRIRSAVPGDVVNDEYNYETATEGERWAYDQGYEDGWQARLNPDAMELAEFLDQMVEAMQAMNAKLEQQKARPEQTPER